ncbi:MAG: beta-ketoacyl-[acyl-carrier-protein] synthase family protein [Rhodospirillaceae bacterium]|nr:beta-ketoacyl-[acyl-carrier-protein] synthase family protein [Rhodospirillaceae bacterium]
MADPVRVAVTGIGSISSLGHNVGEIWAALEAGKSGIAPLTRVPLDQVNIKIAAEVKDYDEAKHFDERELLVFDRYTQFALLSAAEAVTDAGLDFAKDEALGLETATIIASGVGGWSTIDTAFYNLHKLGKPRAHPLTIPRMMISAAASQISMKYGLKGPAFCVSSACSSANHAIGEAYWMIRTGRARAAVTGGSEASISLTAQRSWEGLRVMAPDTCRPFSKGRKGMVLGEGAGILVLERLEDAQRRGAKIYCEIVGYGLSADAGDIVMPDPNGAARAIGQALATGSLNPDDIDYVNAHGTGTQLNDATEVIALKSVFGEAAKRLMVTSTKSMHGHALGAASALEAVATIKAIEQGVVPPTANYQAPDPDCDLDHVPNTARKTRLRAALSNSLAFGGLNAVLAFKAA